MMIIEDDKVSLDIHLIFSMANCMHNYPTSIINAMILYSCLSLKLALVTNVDQQLYLMGIVVLLLDLDFCEDYYISHVVPYRNNSTLLSIVTHPHVANTLTTKT